MVKLSALEVQSGQLSTTAPWAVICKLAGALGAVGTQAVRMSETSRFQSTAEVIRDHSTGGTSDPSLALNLRSNLLRATLPKVLRAHGMTADEAGDSSPTPSPTSSPRETARRSRPNASTSSLPGAPTPALLAAPPPNAPLGP